MFCGMGTIRMGMEQAGHRCVYSIEWDKHKRRIYNVIFGREPEGQDIRDIRGFELPRADIWCFGAPCQDFSIAGERKGLAGDKSSLVKEVFRLVRETKEEYRPQYLIYENVKGMLSSNKGFDFLEILAEMASLGYDTIEYSLLDSKYFRVPHHRERVFTIGHFRGRSTRKIFPIKPSMDCKNPAVTLTARGYGSQRNGTYVVTYPKRGCGLIVPEATKKGYNIAYEGDSINLAVPNSKTRRGRIGKGIANTLDRACNQGVFIGGKIRQLTPKECWRLQGVLDTITDKVIDAGISDTQMYRAAGDACTVNVIYEIAKRL